MAVVLYSYSKLCDSGRLSAEIKAAAAITIGEDHIETISSPATTKVFMKAELSGAEEDALDALVDAHVNTPLPDSAAKLVTLDSPKNTDQRPVFHSTPRKRGTITTFAGEGDEEEDELSVGGGVSLELAHASGGSSPEHLYVDFKTAANETYAHAGIVQWKDALFDKFSLHTVPRLSTYTAGSNTFFNIYGGYLVVPAAGNGTASITDMVLVGVPLNEFGDRQGAGYWNAAFDPETGEFEDLTAAPLGDGAYNMFVAEAELDCFCRRVGMLGDGIMPLDTDDSTMIGHNMRIKLTFETAGAAHAWYWCGLIKLYRKKTL